MSTECNNCNKTTSEPGEGWLYRPDLGGVHFCSRQCYDIKIAALCEEEEPTCSKPNCFEVRYMDGEHCKKHTKKVQEPPKQEPLREIPGELVEKSPVPAQGPDDVASESYDDAMDKIVSGAKSLMATLPENKSKQFLETRVLPAISQLDTQMEEDGLV